MVAKQNNWLCSGMTSCVGKAGSGIAENLGGQSLRCFGEMAKSDESCLLVVLVGGGGDIRRPARWPGWSG